MLCARNRADEGVNVWFIRKLEIAAWQSQTEYKTDAYRPHKFCLVHGPTQNIQTLKTDSVW